MFNIFYSLSLKQSDKRLAQIRGRFRRRISKELSVLKQGKEIDPKHLQYLRRRLCHSRYLIAFDQALKECTEFEETFVMEEYSRQIQTVFLHLAIIYAGKEDMEAAYFAYFVSQHKSRRIRPVDVIQNMMVEYMKRNFYCRVNALQALCQFGSEENVVKAISVLDWEGNFLHEKILTEGLMSFSGSHARLTSLLWEKLESFSQKMQLAILNYIRFKSGDYCQGMLLILENSRKDKELRLCAIRYFGKYFYEPARSLLLQFARNRDPLYWEYAAISITSLASYQGEAVIEVLVDAVHSSNWYVRYNAAVSLKAHQLSYTELAQVTGGHDRYAREMLMYQLERKRMEQKEWGAVS